MTSFSRLFVLAAALGIGILWAGTSSAAEPPAVTQAVSIDTKGNTELLLAEAKNNEKIFERLGIKARRRYLQGSFAGTSTGTVIVTIDYPSLAALAAAQEKLANDAEWQKYIEKVTGADMSIVSNSIWVDVTPQ